MELTIRGDVAAPFVRVDNRTLMLSSGTRAVNFALSSLGVWLEETLMIILDDGRATRAQGERLFGGHRIEEGDKVVLYGGERDDLVVVAISYEDLERLQQTVTDTLHHHR